MTNAEIANPTPEVTDPELAPSDVPEQFHVHDDDSANWVIRKIVECRSYAERCAEWCEREQARAKREEEFFFFRYGQQLFNFARQKIAAAGGRRKSVGLPAGTVGLLERNRRIRIHQRRRCPTAC